MVHLVGVADALKEGVFEAEVLPDGTIDIKYHPWRVDLLVLLIGSVDRVCSALYNVVQIIIFF